MEKNPPKRKFTRTAQAATIVACTVALAACGSLSGSAPPPSAGKGSGSGTRGKVGFAQFSDIAVPSGATMNVDRTLVLGARDAWIGRLALSAPDNATQTYDFFLREMPKFGWQEITTVRSEVSVLTYMRGDRIATVQIMPRTLGGSKVDITVSPRGAGSSSGTPPGMSSGMSQGMPSNSRSSVTTTPLR